MNVLSSSNLAHTLDSLALSSVIYTKAPTAAELSREQRIASAFDVFSTSRQPADRGKRRESLCALPSTFWCGLSARETKKRRASHIQSCFFSRLLDVYVRRAGTADGDCACLVRWLLLCVSHIRGISAADDTLTRQFDSRWQRYGPMSSAYKSIEPVIIHRLQHFYLSLLLYSWLLVFLFHAAFYKTLVIHLEFALLSVG
jgi:hypothetical protein